MEYAGFWQRVGAFWVDLVVLLPLAAVSYYFGEQTRLFQLYWFIPGLVFGLWYHVYLVVKYGGTPGKLLLNMRVAMADNSPVTSRAASIRYSVLFALSVLSSLAVLLASLKMTDQEYFSLGFVARSERLEQITPPWYEFVKVAMQVWIWSEFVTMLFNKKRRAIHDFMAGTVVLKGRRPNPSINTDAAR